MEGIGSCANRLGRPGQAISSITAAMDIHIELGDSYGEAGSWESLGDSYQLLGEYGAAASCWSGPWRCSAGSAAARTRRGS